MRKSSKITNKYDLYDVARILGVSYLTATKLRISGAFKSTKIARRYYVSKRDLNNYLDKGNIFDKPQEYIIKVIKEAIKEAQEVNIERLKLIVKQNMITELEGNIKKNLIKIDRNNVKLTEFVDDRIIKKLEHRTEVIKKELQRV